MCRYVGKTTALRRILLAIVFGMLGVLPAAAEAALALVTDLQGKASVQGAGRSSAVTILAELDSGAQVELEAGGTLVALYLDAGDEYVFKGPAHIVFNPSGPEVLRGAKPVKRSPSLGSGGKGVRIKPVGMAQGAIVMRGFRASARIRLLNLHGTRVLETRPEFRWQELQPGLKYQFEITDEAGSTLYETPLDATSLQLPAGMQLKAGASYSWEVSARLPDGRKYSSAGDFSVAAADLRAQAEALRPAASAPLSTRVAYAAWLQQMELKDEARRYWQAASSERPDDPRLKALAGQ